MRVSERMCAISYVLLEEMVYIPDAEAGSYSQNYLYATTHYYVINNFVKKTYTNRLIRKIIGDSMESEVSDTSNKSFLLSAI